MQFILDNPIFVILIVGYLFSMFSKGKKPADNQKGQSRPSSLPKMDRPGRDFQRPSPIEKEQPSQAKPVLHDDDWQPRIPPIQEVFMLEERKQEAERNRQAQLRMEALKVQEEQNRKRADELLEASSKLNQKAPIMEERKKPSQALRNNSLANAVVWSEILGPPRSKKPHRSSSGLRR